MTGGYVMKRLMVVPVLLAVTLAGLAGLATAEDPINPTGTWKWRLFNQSAENTLKLKLDGDKLTGALLRKNNSLEVPIEDATYKAGMVTFKVNVTSERGDPVVKIVIKFAGTVSGDAIEGTIEFKHPDQTISRDWHARRVEKEFPKP